jgi:hypothetical protein
VAVLVDDCPERGKWTIEPCRRESRGRIAVRRRQTDLAWLTQPRNVSPLMSGKSAPDGMPQ